MTPSSLHHRLRRGVRVALISLVAMTGSAVSAQEVPRNETLVMGTWGFFQELPANNFNPVAVAPFQLQSQIGEKTVYEPLFITNLNNGELIPWLGKSYEVAPDYKSVTVKLRDGVKWSDGNPFTAEDVKFSLDLVKDGGPSVLYSNIHSEWIKDVVILDPLTVQINLTKPGPRYMRDNLALGHENHTVMLPKHIWKGQDPAKFANLDIEKGQPVGTGAYKLVRIGAKQYVFDRRDDWWGVKAGFADLPAPKRIVFIPVASDESMGQLMISNQMDSGNALQPGTFEAVRVQNPKVRSWNAKGPVWGSPDGCGFVLQFNLKKPVWNNADLRIAINYALDRAQLSSLGYEGIFPPWNSLYSQYIYASWVPKQLQGVIDKYDRGTKSMAKVDEYMAKAGYTRNSAGKWSKDGQLLEIPLVAPSFRRQLMPVIAQQLRSAGFTVNEQINDQYTATFEIAQHDTVIIVHCGSISEPYDSLRYLHSKWSRPVGEKIPFRLAGTQFSNAEYDAAIDQMEAILPDSKQGSTYMNLAEKATNIFLAQMPEIPLVEELHIVSFNQTYWTNWPTADTPYVAPYLPWAAWLQVIHNLKPAAR